MKTITRMLADHRVRFLIVGAFNTGFGFVMFVVVDVTIGRALNETSVLLASIVTLIVSHLIAAVIAFILYRRFVFRVSGNVVIDFLRFESVYLLPLGVNALALPALVLWGMDRILAQFLILVVMTFVSYFGHRFFSFRRPASESAAGGDDGPDRAGDTRPSSPQVG